MNNIKPYFLIEAANTHSGSFDYLMELIESFKEYSGNYGIKFQPLQPDTIATPDYHSYPIYQEIAFNKDQWNKAINTAYQTKDVWLDMFDSFGVQVLSDNLNKVYGIKFQSSVLYNLEVFHLLEKINLSKHKIILNVAAQPLEDIKQIISKVEHLLEPEEILLEFGYQAYPTRLEDSGFSKFDTIKEHFKNRIVFADHVDGKSEEAIFLPAFMAAKGVDVIEKHVMLPNSETKYDYHSSLTPRRFKIMVEKVTSFALLNETPFINEREKDYLEKTIMIPILNKDKPKGSLINFEKDLYFRRTSKKGLSYKEILDIQEDYHLLATNKSKGDTLLKQDFKKAVISTIIAGRLKSSRLPKKALLNIGSLSSVERCIKSCLDFKNVNHTVLATSDVDEDAELENYTYRDDVIFHRGDPDDVIKRFLGIAEKLESDIIIRITADMPFVSSEIVEKTLDSHFKNGADYSVPEEFSVGTAAEIMNKSALHTIKNYFDKADYSEYMTWYFQNNPEFFDLNFVKLPDELIRNYRLTLDYEEDLILFNKLQEYLDTENKRFDIRIAFEFLDRNPEIAEINQKHTLRYKTDKTLIETLNRVTKIKSY